MEELNRVLERLLKLQEETANQPFSPKSPYAILEATGEFMKDLPDLLQLLDQARIEWKEEREGLTYEAV